MSHYVMHYTFQELPWPWQELSKTLKFSQLLKHCWTTKAERQGHVFRYLLSSLPERHVCSKYKYILMLNPDRATKRREPVEIGRIDQVFDQTGFNFNKVKQEEILFKITNEKDGKAHPIIVNVSPISKYHSLFCPFMEDCLPQVMTHDSIQLVLEIMFLFHDRDLRIAANSQCAWASVNHLHFHILYESSELPVETMACEQLAGPVFVCHDYPLPGFCLQLSHKHEILSTTAHISKIISHFIKSNVAHNLMITRGRKTDLVDAEKDPARVSSRDDGNGEEVVRVWIWARRSTFGAKQLGTFNIAAVELSGCFTIYNEADFERLSAEDLEEEVRRWQLEDFPKLCKEVAALFAAPGACVS